MVSTLAGTFKFDKILCGNIRDLNNLIIMV